jgi:anaerobic selenocysteine-containing dehydrogenase
MCEAICGLEIETEGNAVTAIRPDPANPFSRGYFCVKGAAMRDIHHDPDRLRHPLRRTRGGGWTRITYEEAVRESAERLGAIREKLGPSAIAVYLGNPNVHALGMSLFGALFLKALGTRSIYSANSQDTNARLLSSFLLYGSYAAFPIPDVDRTGYFLILGGNPAASNGSVMTAPDIHRRMRDIAERGGKVVVIDPRRTETAMEVMKRGGEHHFVRPGADGWLVAAMLWTLWRDRAWKTDVLDEITDGSWHAIPDLLEPFTPDAVAPKVGVDADTIRRLAREFAAAPSAVAYGRVGISLVPFATVTHWFVDLLNIVTGNFDREGGVMFPEFPIDLGSQLAGLSSPNYGKWRSRINGLPKVAGELPCSTLADEIETPGEGQHHALITIAGNPVLSAPNGPRLSEAFEKLDFMLSIDIYRNETTRHADIILPGPFAFERNHMDIVFGNISVRNYIQWSPKLFEPDGEQREEWMIFDDLCKAMGLELVPFGLRELLNAAPGGDAPITPERMVDVLIRSGPFGDQFGGNPDGLTLEKVKAAPHGIDLGPLRPGGRERRLKTPEHRIRAAPDVLVADVARLRAGLEAKTNGDALQLIGRREMRTNNSWMHNAPSLMKGGRHCDLFVHPGDAERLRLADGSEADIASRVATRRVRVRVTDAVMPGVVSLPHGWGHDREGTDLKVAAANPGVSINDLMDEKVAEPIASMSIMNGVPVSVTPA